MHVARERLAYRAGWRAHAGAVKEGTGSTTDDARRPHDFPHRRIRRKKSVTTGGTTDSHKARLVHAGRQEAPGAITYTCAVIYSLEKIWRLLRRHNINMEVFTRSCSGSALHSAAVGFFVFLKWRLQEQRQSFCPPAGGRGPKVFQVASAVTPCHALVCDEHRFFDHEQTCV